jgi:uncharacterized protein (UPF0332 family)
MTREDAELLRRERRARSSISRFYYACYQAAHAIMLCTPAQNDLPAQGNWDHRATMNGVVAVLRRYGSVSPASAQTLRVQLSEAYIARVHSDYGPEGSVASGQLEQCKAAANALVNYARRMVAS